MLSDIRICGHTKKYKIFPNYKKRIDKHVWNVIKLVSVTICVIFFTKVFGLKDLLKFCKSKFRIKMSRVNSKTCSISSNCLIIVMTKDDDKQTNDTKRGKAAFPI